MQGEGFQDDLAKGESCKSAFPFCQVTLEPLTLQKWEQDYLQQYQDSKMQIKKAGFYQDYFYYP